MCVYVCFHVNLFTRYLFVIFQLCKGNDIYIHIYMYTIFYKRFIDDYVIFEICLMASKSARMRGSAHLKAVTVAHQKSYVIYIMSII